MVNSYGKWLIVNEIITFSITSVTIVEVILTSNFLNELFAELIKELYRFCIFVNYFVFLYLYIHNDFKVI